VASAERATKGGRPSKKRELSTQLTTSTIPPASQLPLEFGEEVEVVVRYRGQTWTVKGSVREVSLDRDIEDISGPYDVWSEYRPSGIVRLGIVLDQRKALLET